MPKTSDEPFIEQFPLEKADEDLIRAYRGIGRSVDDLAYTPEFDKLYEDFTKRGHKREKHEVFRRLLILRKSGLLPRLFRSTDAQVPARTKAAS